MSIVFAGCVRNCARFLDSIFENIITLSKEFSPSAVHIVIVLDPTSSDSSKEKLDSWREKFGKFTILLQTCFSSHRTHRIAACRNQILDFLRHTLYDNEFFVMMDFDDVCTGPLNIQALKAALKHKQEWDSVSFNRDFYYDIWALSIKPFIHSCWSWGRYADNLKAAVKMRDTITETLSEMERKGDLFYPCFSAFNGFAVYRTSIFLKKDLSYSGEPFILEKYMKDNESAVGMKFAFNNPEDCEHRAFHINAMNNYGARIRICSMKLFLVKMT